MKAVIFDNLIRSDFCIWLRGLIGNGGRVGLLHSMLYYLKAMAIIIELKGFQWGENKIKERMKDRLAKNCLTERKEINIQQFAIKLVKFQNRSHNLLCRQ